LVAVRASQHRYFANIELRQYWASRAEDRPSLTQEQTAPRLLNSSYRSIWVAAVKNQTLSPTDLRRLSTVRSILRAAHRLRRGTDECDPVPPRGTFIELFVS